MTTVLDGPLNLGTIPVHAGEDFPLQIAVRDGVRTAALPHGALVAIDGATEKGVLTIYKPDGTTTITRDTSVSGEGEKVADAGSGTVDSLRFLVAPAVTATWTVGKHVAFDVEYQDSSTTPATVRTIAYGVLEVRSKPGSTGVALP